MRKKLSLRLYQLQLAVLLGQFVVLVTLTTVPKRVLFLGTSAVVGGVLVLLLLLTRPETTVLEPLTIHASPLPHPELYEKQLLTESELRDKLAYWQQVETVQPTHRDVLVNIALLSQALGEEEQYQTYWERAKKLDPNHAIFDEKE